MGISKERLGGCGPQPIVWAGPPPDRPFDGQQKGWPSNPPVLGGCFYEGNSLKVLFLNLLVSYLFIYLFIKT